MGGRGVRLALDMGMGAGKCHSVGLRIPIFTLPYRRLDPRKREEIHKQRSLVT
jgi:hypothetical protein